jgi:arginyl-tRNA synthetase
VRWAAIGHAPWGYGGSSSPEITVLLDALSWLPERVATAARRGRPDEFARYLEELARATIAALISASNPGSARAPGADRLGVAGAARTGLAAGLGLLGVSAPDRL